MLAVHAKGNPPTDNLLIVECHKHIQLFNLEDLTCEKYLHSIHGPEDDKKIPDKR